MSWLPKEILDHLDHIGYVAVPKDKIDTVHAEIFCDAISVMVNQLKDDGLLRYHADRLAKLIGCELLKNGFIEIDRCIADKYGNITTRATLTALRPRLAAAMKSNKILKDEQLETKR